MKKRNKGLRITAAVIAFGLIGMVLWGIRDFYGDPFSKYRAEKTLTAYAQQHHEDLGDFVEEGVAYNFKDKSYYITYTHRLQPLLSFYISMHSDGEIYDDYEFNYVEGANAWAMYANDKYRELDQSITDACDAAYGYCGADVKGNLITSEEHDAFYQNKNMDTLKILTISGSVQIPDLTDTAVITEKIRKLAAIFEGSDQQIKSYELSIFDETGNKGFYLCNVSKDVMMRDDFPEKLAKVLVSHNSLKESDGFYISPIEAKY